MKYRRFIYVKLSLKNILISKAIYTFKPTLKWLLERTFWRGGLVESGFLKGYSGEGHIEGASLERGLMVESACYRVGLIRAFTVWLFCTYHFLYSGQMRYYNTDITLSSNSLATI